MQRRQSLNIRNYGLPREHSHIEIDFINFKKTKKNGTDICHICHHALYLSSTQILILPYHSITM